LKKFEDCTDGEMGCQSIPSNPFNVLVNLPHNDPAVPEQC